MLKDFIQILAYSLLGLCFLASGKLRLAYYQGVGDFAEELGFIVGKLLFILMAVYIIVLTVKITSMILGKSKEIRLNSIAWWVWGGLVFTIYSTGALFHL